LNTFARKSVITTQTPPTNVRPISRAFRWSNGGERGVLAMNARVRPSEASEDLGSGLRAEGERAGFRVQGSGLRVQGSGFRVQGSGFRGQGSGFRVQGSGFRVQGSGVRGQG